MKIQGSDKLKDEVERHNKRSSELVDETEIMNVLEAYKELQDKNQEVYQTAKDIRELFTDYLQGVLGRQRTSIEKKITVRDNNIYKYHQRHSMPLYRLFGKGGYADILKAQVREDSDESEFETFVKLLKTLKEDFYVDEDSSKYTDVRYVLPDNKLNSGRVYVSVSSISRLDSRRGYSCGLRIEGTTESNGYRRKDSITPSKELLSEPAISTDHYKKMRLFKHADTIYTQEKNAIDFLNKHLSRLKEIKEEFYSETAAVIAANEI